VGAGWLLPGSVTNGFDRRGPDVAPGCYLQSARDRLSHDVIRRLLRLHDERLLEILEG
jgi:hypothetical protein